jgi:hypothetical protein
VSKTRSTIEVSRLALLLAIAAAGAGCASKHDTRGPFVETAPFSKTISGSGDSVCWSIKRALLGQGYMLERSSEAGVLTGTKDYQPEEKLNVTVRLQTSCADNKDGTSIVFATADREESKLQNFYNSFFALVENYVAQDARSHPEQLAESSKQGEQSNK